MRDGATIRRSTGPPAAVPAELVRSSLLDRLSRRFDVPVTTVVAGAGFGKTTLLAQALRANQAAPRGLDAWVSCEPGDEDAHRLARVVSGALGSSPSGRDPVEGVLEALRALSPVDVCLVLDDLHEVPAASTSAGLLAEVTRRLPPHAHLLLASREPVALPLARLRAGGQVVELGAGDLAFTPAEAATLSERRGHDAARVEGLAGWPSLVSLALSAPRGAEGQFLWEEVVAGLAADDQAALLGLATLGWGSAADVGQVAAVTVDVDLLAARVPLVSRGDDGGYAVHQLWEEAVERLFDPEQVATVRARTLELLRGRGETLRLGSRAVRWQASDAARAASASLVQETFGALPVDTAARWLAGMPEDARGSPEGRLLALALRHARHTDDAGLDAEIDELVEAFAAAGNSECEAIALALGAVVAHFRGDEVRLFVLAERVRALPNATQEPILRFLTGAVSAALAALAGEVDEAVRLLDLVSYDDVPPSVTELVLRLHVAMLVLAGRARDAVEIGVRLERSSSPYVRGIPPMLAWLAGNPGPVLAGRRSADPSPEINERDRLYHAAYGTAVAASVGDHDTIAAAQLVVDKVLVGRPDARDSAIATLARAHRLIAQHDEDAAARALVEHLTRHPLAHRQGEAHLRRTPALAYVLNEDVRRHWDAVPFGPSHQPALVCARLLVGGRAGEPPADASLPDATSVLTSLPLPWSVELAARAHGTGRDDGAALLARLSAWAPLTTHHELVWLARHGDAEARRGALALLAASPEPSTKRARVEVLGPLRLSIDGVPVHGPELRRGRVRALLALLVVCGPVRRERVMDVMWPDLDPPAAARNLRVTLTRLRQLLDPGRRPGAPGARLKVDGDLLSLDDERVDVDLWELHGHAQAAEAAQRAGDSVAAARHLGGASALWRGEPLADLVPLDAVGADREQACRAVVDVTLRLGELQLVAGRFDESVMLAERVKAASPYDERAHRLAIAAQLQRQDRVATAAAVRDTEAMLAELAVEPEPTTQMLLRQASARLGSLVAGAVAPPTGLHLGPAVGVPATTKPGA